MFPIKLHIHKITDLKLRPNENICRNYSKIAMKYIPQILSWDRAQLDFMFIFVSLKQFCRIICTFAVAGFKLGLSNRPHADFDTLSATLGTSR